MSDEEVTEEEEGFERGTPEESQADEEPEFRSHLDTPGIAREDEDEAVEEDEEDEDEES